MDIITGFSWNALIEPNINIWNLFLRMILSFILGGIIGFNQEKKGRPAGLRTHIIIALGATMIMMLSINVAQHFQTGNPGRIAAQVVSGIGFLGAGAIIKYGVNVIGLTTAASIWTTAGIGLTIGIGLYPLSIVGTIILVITLNLIRKIEKRIFKRRKRTSRLIVSASNIDVILIYHTIEKSLKNFDIKISHFSFSINNKTKASLVNLSIRQPRNVMIFDVIKEINKLDYIKKIEVQNL